MAMKRFRVAGHSMTPTLQPGQEVVALDTRRPDPGNLVVFEHPGREGFWLIKRLEDATGWVISDNPAISDSDSRTLGPIPVNRMLTVIDSLDGETFVAACEMLAAEDEHLARLIEVWGIPPFWQRSPGFPTLVWLILEQQVSLESGAAMFRRLAGLIGPVTPENVLAVGEPGLVSIGVTRQKTSYLLDISGRLVSGDLELDSLDTMDPSSAREILLGLRGVGPWTADAYLLSALRLPDMWPVGDRALQVGAAEVLGMSVIPDQEMLEIIADPWRPVRAVAARLIWHAYLSERGRREPSDPSLARGPGPDA